MTGEWGWFGASFCIVWPEKVTKRRCGRTPSRFSFIYHHTYCVRSQYVCGQEALLSERLNCGRWLREQTDWQDIYFTRLRWFQLKTGVGFNHAMSGIRGDLGKQGPCRIHQRGEWKSVVWMRWHCMWWWWWKQHYSHASTHASINHARINDSGRGSKVAQKIFATACKRFALPSLEFRIYKTGHPGCNILFRPFLFSFSTF